MIETPVSGSIAEVHRPHIRWSAVFAGWVVAFGIAWLFYLAGIAVGFSSFDPGNADLTAKGVGIGTLVWLILTWAASLFMGGMFASWVDGRNDQTVGSLHGVAVWGLAMTVTVLLSAMGFTQLLQGGASLVGGVAGSAGAGAMARAPNQGGPSSGPAGLLSAQVRRAVADQGAATTPQPANAAQTAPSPSAPASSQGAARGLSDDAASAIAADLLRGRNEDASARLAADSGLSQADADKVFAGLSAQAEKAKAQMREAADQVRRYTAAVMWGLLLSGLLALVTAALGGWMGAGHIHRVHDGRRYSP
jgi:hypothetical protein